MACCALLPTLFALVFMGTLPIQSLARSLQGTGVPGVVQLDTTGSQVTFEAGCSAATTIDNGVMVWGGPVYGGRVVLSTAAGGVLGEDLLSIPPQSWGIRALPCPGLRITSFALQEFGLLLSPATNQAYADPAVVEACMQRVVYSNNKGSNATPGLRMVTFEVYGGPNGALPSYGTDTVDVTDLLPDAACPGGRFYR